MEKSPSAIPTEDPIEVSIVDSKPEDETKADETEVLSEKLNNLIIRVSELTNMDPLEYFSRFLDIPEMILKHLSGKDVLAASEVSPSYYNFIASSKVLMQKIQIVFDRNLDYNAKDLVWQPNGAYSSYNYYNYTTSSTDLMDIEVVFNDKSATQLEDFNLLKNSLRLYQNIEVRRWKVNIKDGNGNHRKVGDYLTDSELDFLCSKSHEWKNVSIENVYFRKKLDLWRLLSAIESSVESITVDDDGALSFEDPSSEIESFAALKFPKLKLLSVHIDANSFIETLFKLLLNSVAIDNLYLNDVTGGIGKDVLTKMLEKFDKLKSLLIVSIIAVQIFKDESWKNFQFKLKSLTMFSLRPRDRDTNFLNFIKSQSEHLEELWIELNCEEREIIDVIMTLPKLKILELTDFKAFSENEVPNKKSTSITELILDHFNISAVSLKYLLNLMPNVTILSLQSIDEEHFKMLKSMKRKFEKLRVRELKGVDIEEMEEIMTENYILLELVNSND